jgi:hypothetical protein
MDAFLPVETFSESFFLCTIVYADAFRNSDKPYFFCAASGIYGWLALCYTRLRMAELTDSVALSEGHDDGASLDEVQAAIRSLTEEELLRLERYARFRIRSLGGRTLGRDHEDLLREALVATLGGERRWKRRKVSFFTHLVGVMRSLSSHWNEKERNAGVFSESELSPDPLKYSPLHYVSSSVPGPDRIVEAQQEIRRIEAHFSSDSDVMAILHGLKEGMTGPEIQVASKLDRKDYESAMKRMRRGVERLEQSQ